MLLNKINNETQRERANEKVRMDVDPTNQNLEERTDLHREEGLNFIGELDLNLSVSKEEEGSEARSDRNGALSDSGYGLEMDLNQQEPRGSPMQPVDGGSRGEESAQLKHISASQSECSAADFRHHSANEIHGSPLVQSELSFDDVKNEALDLECDPETLSSSPKDKDFSGLVEAVTYDDSNTVSPSDNEDYTDRMETESLCNKKRTEETMLPVISDADSEKMMGNHDSYNGKSLHGGEKNKDTHNLSNRPGLDKMESAYESEIYHYTTKHTSHLRAIPNEENFQCMDKHPTENGEVELDYLNLHSPRSPYNGPVSPGISPSNKASFRKQPYSPKKGIDESSHLPSLSKERRTPSPERPTTNDTGVRSHGGLSSLVKGSSDSPRRSLKRDHKRSDHSPHNSLSISPRRKHSSDGHRRRDRSASRSPIRRKVSPRGHRRDNRDRSRSSSPYTRDHRRGSRRMPSPRRRSPRRHHPRRFSPSRRPWSPPPNRSTGVGRPGKNLFVAGFSFITTERDLERKFSRFGRVTGVRIVRDKRTGDSRGFGFLSLERDEDADAAIRALDQTEWNGRIVLVEKSKTSAP